MPVKYKRLTADQKRANLEKRRIKEGRAQPKKNGRPKAEISLEAAEQLAALHPTEKELAAGLGVTYTTFHRRMQEEPELAEAVERGRANGMLKLRKLQWEHAKKDGGPAVNMSIFLGKNMLGQIDRPVETHKTVDVNIEISSANERIAYKLDQLRERIMGPGQSPVLPELEVLGDVIRANPAEASTETDGEFVESRVAGVEVGRGDRGIQGEPK